MREYDHQLKVCESFIPLESMIRFSVRDLQSLRPTSGPEKGLNLRVCGGITDPHVGRATTRDLALSLIEK